MKSILYIGNVLSKHGFTPTGIETLGPLLEKEKYKVHYLSNKRNQYKRLLAMLAGIVVNKNRGVVLIDTYSTKAFYFSWACARLCKLLKIKYIPILRGGNMPVRMLKNPVLSRQLFKYSFTNVVISGYLKKYLDEKGYRNQLIPNNIDLNMYPLQIREHAKPKILWVRSFHEMYNPQLAIKLLKEISRSYPDAFLTMVGPDKDGSLQLCKALSEDLGVAGNVNFTGKLTKREWVSLSQSHDIFLNTTNYDNLPVSVIEAMALGMLIISTDVGGMPYLITDHENGLLVHQDDLKGMMNCVDTLMNDNNLVKMLSSNARSTAASTFDWPVVCRHWNSLLKPLVNES